MQDIKTEEDVTSNKKLTKKDYKRTDVIHAKQTELEKFFKFNVVKEVTYAPLYRLGEGARNWYDRLIDL